MEVDIEAELEQQQVYGKIMVMGVSEGGFNMVVG